MLEALTLVKESFRKWGREISEESFERKIWETYARGSNPS